MNLWVKSLWKKEKDLCMSFFLVKWMKTSEWVCSRNFIFEQGLDPDMRVTFKEGAWSYCTNHLKKRVGQNLILEIKSFGKEEKVWKPGEGNIKMWHKLITVTL